MFATLCARLPYGLSALLLLGLFAAPTAQAQAGRSLAQAGRPLTEIDGIRVAGGLSIFMGDLDSNPDNNPLTFIGAGSLHLMGGLDHTLGENATVGLELSYDRLHGRNTPNLRFTNNALSLDLTVNYDLPVVRPHLFNVFAGVGPMLLFSPSYQGFPENDDRYDERGTQVIPSLKLGIGLQNTLRIGVRLTTSDFIDGHVGASGEENFDLISFISIGHRFNLSH